MLIAVRGYQLAAGEGLNNKLGLNKVPGAKQLSLERSCSRGDEVEKMGEDRCSEGHLTRHKSPHKSSAMLP